MWFPGIGAAFEAGMSFEEAARALNRVGGGDRDLECTCGDPADRPCTVHDGMGGIDEVRGSDWERPLTEGATDD